MDKYCPRYHVDPGRLPWGLADKTLHHYYTMKTLMEGFQIDMENPAGAAADDLIWEDIHKSSAKHNNTTWYKKSVALKWLIGMIDAALNGWVKDIKPVILELVGKMVPKMGIAFLVYTIDREEFTSLPLKPFRTSGDRRSFIWDVVSENKMIIPVPDELDTRYGEHQKWVSTKLPIALNSDEAQSCFVDFEKWPVCPVPKIAKKPFWVGVAMMVLVMRTISTCLMKLTMIIWGMLFRDNFRLHLIPHTAMGVAPDMATTKARKYQNSLQITALGAEIALVRLFHSPLIQAMDMDMHKVADTEVESDAASISRVSTTQRQAAVVQPTREASRVENRRFPQERKTVIDLTSDNEEMAGSPPARTKSSIRQSHHSSESSPFLNTSSYTPAKRLNSDTDREEHTARKKKRHRSHYEVDREDDRRQR
ncbi:uncharacterized protein RSE6_09273 [Rhynchosporium secalis]|uniref:Uncharacterized protein n=1 Tax=Rhynchosporium secalis TaxID=38038 RepID=A0A1E1MHI4_RHYSE|nr:uncharacterized protein RSE6_09273 [Rhynchosporium secalis]